MKYLCQFGLLLACLGLVGCGGDASMDVPATSAAPPSAAPPVQAAISVSTPAPAVAAPPTGAAPAALAVAPDPLESHKISRDGSPNKTDIQALQSVVDAYAFGTDGLGAPPLNSLDDLVTKGFLKKLPAAPQGMKWAYDSAKWKVSVVPQ
jgi:hypothetical protein